MTRSAFPLQWPDDWKRTEPSRRAKSKFGFRQSGDIPFSFAYQELRDELARLGAVNVVITTDLPVNSRGIPYADARKSGEVGVAAWFVLADRNGTNRERVHACDKWRTVAENMVAISKSIEAMRGLERWGAADVVNRAFEGFTALPASGETSEGTGAPEPPRKRPWREVLGGGWPALDKHELLALAKARHRKQIEEHHPDRGGDPAIAAALNVAMDEAEAEFA